MKASSVWTIPPVIVHQTLMASQLSGELPWHITEYGIDKYLWPRTQGKTMIGIVDTGVSANHPTLDGCIKDARDFTNSRYGYEDVNSHGTHCAANIVSKDFGVAKGHKIVVAKGLRDNGVGVDDEIGEAIDWVASQSMIISLSLGANQRSTTISSIIKKWYNKGRLFFVASGNDSGPTNWPAREDFVDAVTAIDRRRRIAQFSSRGDASDVCAPGVEIRSAGAGNSYVVMSGTSMATPWAAGVAAVWMDWRISAGKTATLDDYNSWLKTSAVDLGKPGPDAEYGIGLPDPEHGFVETPEAPGPIAPPTSGKKVASVVVTMNDGSVEVLRSGK